jgi:hypothetical protein
MDAALVLSMQRLAGNRSTTALVAQRAMAQGGPTTVVQRQAATITPQKVRDTYRAWLGELASKAAKDAEGGLKDPAGLDDAAKKKTQEQVGDANYASWEKWEASQSAEAGTHVEEEKAKQADEDSKQAKEKAAGEDVLNPSAKLHSRHDEMWQETAKIRAEVVQTEYLAGKLNFGEGAKGTAARLTAGAYIAEWGIGARSISALGEHVPIMALSGVATVFGSELGERKLVEHGRELIKADQETAADQATAERLVSGQMQAAYQATRAPYNKYMEALNAFTTASSQFTKDLAVDGMTGYTAQAKDIGDMESAEKAMQDAAAEYQATCQKMGVNTEAKALGKAAQNIEKGREGAVETAVTFGLPEVAPGLGEMKSALKGVEGMTAKELEKEGMAAVESTLKKQAEEAALKGGGTAVKAGEEAGASTLTKAGEEAGASTLTKTGEEAGAAEGKSALAKAGEEAGAAAKKAGGEAAVKEGEEAIAKKAAEGTPAKGAEPGGAPGGGEGPAFSESASAPADGQEANTMLGQGEKAATAEELAWQEKSGMPVKNQRAMTETCQQHQVVIDVRGTNVEAPRRLAEGNLPKPEAIKAKSINELDTYIGFRKDDQGLVGFKEPTPPVESQVPPEQLADVKKRYDERLKEFHDLAKDMENLSRPPDARDQFQAVAFDKQVAVDSNGVVRVVNKEGQAGVGFTGDHDIFQITNLDGTPVTGEKYNEIVSELAQKGVGVEHGAHMHWDVPAAPPGPAASGGSIAETPAGTIPTTPGDAAALYKDPTKGFKGIAEKHTSGSEPLFRFKPDGTIETITPDAEASTLEAARKAGRADKAAAVGGESAVEATVGAIGPQ